MGRKSFKTIRTIKGGEKKDWERKCFKKKGEFIRQQEKQKSVNVKGGVNVLILVQQKKIHGGMLESGGEGR